MPSVAQAEYGIKDIWSNNLEEEFRKIRQVIQQYKYVAMVRMCNFYCYKLASVAQLAVHPTEDRRLLVRPPLGCQHSLWWRLIMKYFLWEIDHEILSVFILSLLLIQEGQLSVSGERMYTVLVNCLED